MKRRGAKLGQHFLTGQWAAIKLAEAARVETEDTILEIGPGKGALTKELLQTGAQVIAIEKDEQLAEGLIRTFEKEVAYGQLKIFPEDIRGFDTGKIPPGPYVLAANIPYYITGEIIRQFLSDRRQPKTMALLIQKEVADRILARDGKESILSISVKAYGEPEIAAKVPRGNFNPPPSVDSAILVVRNISKKKFSEVDEVFFFKVVRAGFASKRKYLTSNLAKGFGPMQISHVFAEIGLPEKIRAEDLNLDQWLALSRSLLRASRMISSPPL